MPTFRGKRQTRYGTPAPQGGVGSAMADGIKSMTYATKDTSRFEEDSDGLLPSDHIMEAMGNALEARGAKRI
jgi:hypothetical protein